MTKNIFSSPSKLLICLLFLLSSLKGVSNYSLSGNVLTDLGSNFLSDAGSWSMSSCYSYSYDWWSDSYYCDNVVYYYCSGIGNYVLGGYATIGAGAGNYYYTTYYSLPSHNQINFQMTAYAFDSWDGGSDRFELYFSGSGQYSGWALTGFSGYGTQLCGNPSYTDFPAIRIKMTIPHTATSSLQFRVVSYLNEDSSNESIGFRDITMTFVTVGSPSYSICGSSGGALPSSPCSCSATNMYMSPASSGTCYYCEGTCATCNGGYATNCQSCYSNRYLSGTQCNPCAYNCLTCNDGTTASCLTCQPSYPYMVNNNQCVVDCPYPLYSGTSSGKLMCYTPCPGQYTLSWDGTCSADCATIRLTPYVYNTFNLCSYPCSASQYLYWDKACDNSCPAPLSIRIFHTKNFCDHTCTTTTDYLYWDQGCESFCNSPLTYSTTHGRKICQYNCAINQYLYWDGTCGNTCFYPLVIRNFHSRQFCDFPCTTSQYLYWNNTCLSSCSFPLSPRTQNGQNYCDYPCSGSQFLAWNGTCLATCNTPLIQRVEGSSRFCDYPCPTNQIAHWTGTCVTSCLSPRSYVQEGNPMVRNFCVFPCATTQYLYWNATCGNACNAPLKTVSQESRYFCQYPCSASQYLYWNGTCGTSCPFPLFTRPPEASLNYCDFPCASSEYLYWNGSCRASCASPLSARTTDGNYYCDYPCQSNEYLYWDGVCRSSCNSPLYYRLEASKNYCDYLCTGTDYLYWNTSCIGTCTLFTPRVSIGKNFCDFQCGSTQYIYWDRSCSDTCASPLTYYTEGSPVRYFCYYPCATSEYLYWNGTCASSCDFPLSSRIQNSRNFCSLPCDTSQYLYWNGSCIATCPSPLVTRIEASRLYCDYPCVGTQSLAWNGTCLTTCASPLVNTIVKGNYFCYYPCADTSRYLYWDGTCASTCNNPLIPVQEGTPNRNFCLFGCDSSQYLYWNGSCVASCTYPLTITSSNSRYYCNYPCAANQYLYWDQYCGSSCPYPQVNRTEGTPSRNFCDYPCTGSDILYWNASCISTCPYPLTTRSGHLKYYCDYPCNTDQYLFWDKTCSSSCNLPLSTRTEGDPPRNFCDYPCTSGYLYWNGSCLATCQSPLSARQTQGKWFCDYPCSLSQYLYWNTSCLGGCAFPLSTRVEADRNYCDYLCTGTQYLYWNGSCIDSCIAPLNIRIDAGNRYCDYKCLDTQILRWDGTCITSCDSPRTLRVEGTPSRNFCTYDCLTTQFLYWNSTCASTCKFPLQSKAISSRLFCVYPCAATEFLNWDGTCISTCPLPYYYRLEAGQNYCDYPCDSSQFLYWNGSCIATCASPLVQRTASGYQFCDYPCTTDQYLYWDGTCSSTCQLPFTTVIEGQTVFRKFCTDKCTSASDYLYWNGSCISTCNSPLTSSVMNGKKLCNFPCDTTEYLYWDGSCSSNCPTPLTTKTEGTAKYCLYSCDSSEYMYYNGTCSSTCNPMFSARAEKGVYYCDFPCQDTEYLYWNSTCADDCPEPLNSTIETSIVMRKFCNFPCGTYSFLDWDSECISSCDSPYRMNVSSMGRFCELPCVNTSEYYYVGLGGCKDGCELPYTVNTSVPYLLCSPPIVVVETTTTTTTSDTGTTLFSAFLEAPVGNGTFTLVQVVKAMKYLRFLDIKLPPRLERFGASNGKGLLSFHSGSRRMLENAASDLVGGSVSSAFSRENIDSDFIANYWGTFLFIVIAIGAAILFTICEKICQRFQLELLEAVFKRFRVITRWNLGVMLLASSIDDVILYASIEFRADGTVPISGFSLAMCIIFILLSIACLVGVFLLVRKYQQIKLSKIDAAAFENKWQDLQVVFRGFNDNKRLNAYFYLIYMIKIGFPMFITVCAPGAPVLITLVQLLTSVAIIAYLLKMKPFKKRINQVQLFIYETVVFVLNFCMFVLTMISVTDTDGGDFSVVLGDIVILGNDGLNLIAIIFLVIRCIMEANSIRKDIYSRDSHKTQKKYEMTLYLQLFALFFQQINMGFEELIEDHITVPSKAVKKEETDMKSLVTEKTEVLRTDSVLRTESFAYPTRKSGKNDTMLIQEEKVFEATREEGWLPELTGGYRGGLSESHRVDKTNEDHLSRSKEEDVEDLNTTNPRYQKLEGESSSPVASNNENMQLYSFRPQKLGTARKEGENKDDFIKEQGESSPEPQQLESLTLFRKSLVQHKKSHSQSIAVKEVSDESAVTASHRETTEPEERVPTVILPSVYQVTPVQKPQGTEKTKQFLNYAWKGVETIETEGDVSRSDRIEKDRKHLNDLRAFVGEGQISEPPTESDRFNLPTSKDEDNKSINLHGLEKYDVSAWKSTERNGRNSSSLRDYSGSPLRSRSIGKPRQGY